MADDEKKQVHQIPIEKRKPFEIYRVLPTIHSVTAKTNQWVMIRGLQKTIKVTEDAADIIVICHGHAHAQTTAARIDLGIFVDDKLIGIDGTKGAPHWSAA
eukprot:250571_1